MALSRNNQEHLKKNSKEFSQINNTNFELQNSADCLNNRLDTAEERIRALTREIWENQKEGSAFGIKKNVGDLENRIKTHIHLFGVNKGKNVKKWKKIDIQRINGFEFFRFPESHVSSVLEAQQYQ